MKKSSSELSLLHGEYHDNFSVINTNSTSATTNNNKKNNLIIADNLSALASGLLSEFKNSIKMIYIDPPYNTQTEKSYNDKINSELWQNNISDLIMRLNDYLKDDGVIFISIDDNEYASLKIICDNMFEKSNFIGTFITRQSLRSNSKFINTIHEYVLCYAKDKSRLGKFSIKRMDIPEQREMINDISSKIKKSLSQGIKYCEKELNSLIEFYCDKYNITWLKNYNCIDRDGEVYFASDLSVPGEPRSVDIEQINLHLAPLKTRSWVSDSKFIELYEKKLLVFRNDRPYFKKYLKESEDNAPSVLNFYSRHGTKDLEKLGLRNLFDTPKPVELIKFLIRVANVKSGEYVLDCFAGSGTTGQAVLEVNIEDSNDIKFILIQRKERISEKNIIYKICTKYDIQPFVSEITKLRLEKVCEKLKLNKNKEYVIHE